MALSNIIFIVQSIVLDIRRNT